MTDHLQTLLYQRITGLAQVSGHDLEQLFGVALQRHVSKGEIVLTQGQVCKMIVFVEKGYLRSFTEKDGNEINTAFTFEGDFATNLKSLRNAIASDTTIQAGEPGMIFEFDKEQLLELYALSPAIESFGRNLLEQLLIKQEDHISLLKMTPAERYHYLQAHQPELLQRISLSQLASYIGVARETLSRIRKNK